MSRNRQWLKWPATAFALACAFLAAVVSGCGRGAGPALTPVSGKVTMSGQAITSGNVVLTPESPKEGAPASAGQIESNGTYEIQTGGKRGAPLGKYKVTVTPATMPVQGKDSLKLAPFHPKYRDPKTTTLSYEVVAEPKAGAYDLALTPAP